ncbi:hypothetical protein BaRGS_00034160, partial [Batillaria attramentaria]
NLTSPPRAPEVGSSKCAPCHGQTNFPTYLQILTSSSRCECYCYQPRLGVGDGSDEIPSLPLIGILVT